MRYVQPVKLGLAEIGHLIHGVDGYVIRFAGVANESEVRPLLRIWIIVDGLVNLLFHVLEVFVAVRGRPGLLLFFLFVRSEPFGATALDNLLSGLGVLVEGDTPFLCDARLVFGLFLIHAHASDKLQYTGLLGSGGLARLLFIEGVRQ